MGALSLRLDSELEMRLIQEVERRKTSKTRFVQDLLRQALEPKDPIALLYASRKHYGLPDPQAAAITTKASGNTKQLAREAVQSKHARGLASTEQALAGQPELVVEETKAANAANTPKVAKSQAK